MERCGFFAGCDQFRRERAARARTRWPPSHAPWSYKRAALAWSPGNSLTAERVRFRRLPQQAERCFSIRMNCRKCSTPHYDYLDLNDAFDLPKSGMSLYELRCAGYFYRRHRTNSRLSRLAQKCLARSTIAPRRPKRMRASNSPGDETISFPNLSLALSYPNQTLWPIFVLGKAGRRRRPDRRELEFGP
jgi:hypothetical protein